MIYRKLTLVFAVLVLLVIGGSGSALAEKVCFQCHTKAQFAKKVVHEPLAKGNCVACHNPHVANHEGLLQENLKELCISCHQKTFDTKGKKAVVHSPVRQGKCTACHDPHSSNNRNLLKGKLTEVCLGCHKGLKRKYKNTHKPYAKGQCSACHAVHWADNFQLLVKAPAKICRTCHSAGEIKGAHKNYPVQIGECLSCHNPHGSERKAMIRDVLHQPFKEGCNDCHDGSTSRISQETCLGCHEEISRELFSIHNHLTETRGNGCTNCHTPHAGNTNKLLKGRQVLLCRNCHNDTFKRHEDTTFIHTATFNDCNICHAVHGSNQVALLKDDGNSVCLGCHPNQGQFSHPVGENIRDPRNKQMTTCVSCHNPHGTNFKGQLKLSGQEDLCVQCHHM